MLIPRRVLRGVNVSTLLKHFTDLVNVINQSKMISVSCPGVNASNLVLSVPLPSSVKDELDSHKLNNCCQLLLQDSIVLLKILNTKTLYVLTPISGFLDPPLRGLEQQRAAFAPALNPRDLLWSERIYSYVH